MPISLTRFVDFINSTGLKKIKVITEWQAGGEYETYKDFYKNFREAVIKLHSEKLPIEELQRLIHTSNDTKRIHFRALLLGYQKWAEKKRLSFESHTSLILHVGGIDITMNPELCLRINNQPTLIKLYFKEEKLQKQTADIILTMLLLTYSQSENYKNHDVGILDVRNAKLHKLTKAPQEDIIKLITMEAEYWSKLAQ